MGDWGILLCFVYSPGFTSFLRGERSGVCDCTSPSPPAPYTLFPKCKTNPPAVGRYAKSLSVCLKFER